MRKRSPLRGGRPSISRTDHEPQQQLGLFQAPDAVAERLADAPGGIHHELHLDLAARAGCQGVFIGFETPTRKFEFYSEQMAKKGLNPLPEYVPVQDRTNSTYPLALINWKEALHTHSRTMNNRWLMEFHGGNELWINMNKASSLGIRDGDTVTVVVPWARATSSWKVAQ